MCHPAHQVHGDPLEKLRLLLSCLRSAASCLEMTRSSHTLTHDHELLVQGTESVLRRRNDFFPPFFKMFEWLVKVFSSLSTWLILSSAPELPASCSNSWCLEGNSLKSSVCSSRSSAFSFLLSERVQTGLSVEAFKMICQVCFVSSFFRNVGVQLILLCILGVEMHVKCMLSFATSVSSWLLLPNHCLHLCLPIPLTFSRAAARCLTFHTHSSSLDLNFNKDSRALCGDAAVFIYCPEYSWVCGSFFHVSLWI